jgi:CRP/FNR family transcriptional regulator, cyclic AMP receptor protein
VRVALDQTEGGVTRRLPHGEVIVRQGQAGTSLFLVTAGAVRLSSVTASGREVVVGLLCRGDLFGESALLGDPSQVHAQAVGPTTVLALPISSLRAILERNPETAEQLLRLIAGRLRELATDHGVPGPAGVRLRVPITQDELARMVGASREAVNRSVGALTARGLVRSSGRRLFITDPDALERHGSQG